MAPDPAWFRLDPEGDRPTLHLLGHWRLLHLPQIEAALQTLASPGPATIAAQGLAQIDSASALVLLRRLTALGVPLEDLQWLGLNEAQARTVAQVRASLQAPPAAAPRRLGLLARIGRPGAELAALLWGHTAYLGGAVASLAALLLHPRRLRVHELTVQLEQTGLNAIPVVMLVTALIGVVMAYLLGLQAEKYGANIFVVDGVAVGAAREFAPIIVAVVVAGRSGAAFTAQLGSMRLTEETDAIRTLGLHVWQVLVVPRVLALMLTLPLLVFIGDVASLLGAMAVTDSMLGIPPAAFVARLQEALPVRHVLVGLFKAPVFALVIAVIGTRMGMTVGRDTRALGMATTSTVVQSIVAVILLDAAFAVLFQALDL